MSIFDKFKHKAFLKEYSFLFRILMDKVMGNSIYDFSFITKYVKPMNEDYVISNRKRQRK